MVTRKQHRAGYPLHKRVLLHPLSVFFLLCVGVFMGGWTYQVVAATIISSTIQAAPLRKGATVTSPQTVSQTTTSTSTVSGSCPTASYVSLTINGSYSGTAMCGDNGAYDITSSLYPGTNTLRAQDYNAADTAGPATAPIRITYDSSVLPVTTTTTPRNSDSITGSTSGNSSSTSGNSITPILLTSSFHFHTFTTKQAFDWTMDLEGGSPPYVVNIEWGDGTSSTLRFPEDPVFHIHHDYTTPGYYPVIVKSADSSTQTHVMQLAALITDNNGHAAFLGSTGGSDAQSVPPTISSAGDRATIRANVKWLFLAWPTYLIIILMTVSFWLGERQELSLLRIKLRRSTTP